MEQLRRISMRLDAYKRPLIDGWPTTCGFSKRVNFTQFNGSRDKCIKSKIASIQRVKMTCAMLFSSVKRYALTANDSFPIIHSSNLNKNLADKTMTLIQTIDKRRHIHWSYSQQLCSAEDTRGPIAHSYPQRNDRLTDGLLSATCS